MQVTRRWRKGQFEGGGPTLDGFDISAMSVHSALVGANLGSGHVQRPVALHILSLDTGTTIHEKLHILDAIMSGRCM